MTFIQLALGITGALAIQVAVFAAYAFFKHWQAYLQLRATLAHPDGAIAPDETPSSATTDKPGWPGLRSLRVSRKVTEDATKQICSFYLEPEDGKPLPAFFPGQFLTFRLETPQTQGPDGKAGIVTRCYSLSDAPQAPAYRVSIKREAPPPDSDLPPGKSSNYFHDHVHIGSLLQVRAPSGHFYLAPGSGPVVLIGGGIGLTPMMSMLNWCASAQPQREVWLFYGVRNGTELAMLADLQGLAAQHAKLQVHLCFSKPNTSDLQAPAGEAVHRHAERVTVDLLRRVLPLRPFHYYLCGPTPMLTSLVPALEDWGVPEEHIHFEAFGPASVPRKNTPRKTSPDTQTSVGTAAVTVTFAKSGKQCQWLPGSPSLLAFAEDLGIRVDSGCRAGSCGSCQTTIQAGEVQYLQTPDADPDTGTCLLCVCVPKTDLTLDA